jgi:hypothetical protein
VSKRKPPFPAVRSAVPQPTAAAHGAAPRLTLPQAVQQAGIAFEAGDWLKAEHLCRLILTAQPGCFDALTLLGRIALRMGRAQDAAELLGRAVIARPDAVMAHIYLGVALMNLQRFAEALQSFERALQIQPRSGDLHFNRGNALYQMNRFDEAVASYERAIEISPDHADAHRNRGNALRELKRREAALESYDAAIRIKPNYAEVHNSRGVTLRELLRFDAALESYERALGINPRYAHAHYNRGVVLKDLRQWDAALDSYDRAIEIDPSHAEAIAGRGILRLLRGDFERGWRDYEWRFANRNRASIMEERSFPCPRWTGVEPIAGKTILVHCEQGLGDTLQFCRYVAVLADLGARVILEAPRTLFGVMRNLAGLWQLGIKGDALPEFEYQCPLLSLPMAFNTHLGSLPAAVPYLGAEPAKVARWQARLGEKTVPRIGLVWRGNPLFPDNHHRSFALADLLTHLPAGCQYFSLQKELSDADRATLQAHPDVLNAGPELADFADTAALCACLDLLITTDTSVAHLSGALGKPTWILLHSNSDWRWLLDRVDSPWYPTTRLYRQSRLYDWEGVFARVGSDVSALVGRAGS